MENELSDLQTKLKNGFIPESAMEATKQKIAKLSQDIQAKKIELGFEIPKVEVDKIQEKLEDITKRYNEIQRVQNVSSFDQAVGNTNDVLSNIESQMNFYDSLIQQLHEIQNQYEELGQSGTEAFKSVGEEITNVTSKQIELGTKASIISDNRKKLESQSEAWGNYAEMIGGVSNAMNVLGNSQEAQMAQFAANTAAIIANAVSTIAAMNAEAIAKGASSAFSLPFPANLAALATIVATVTSIFASLPKFADGGIVGGGSMYGDKVLTRLNSGEMVLNRRQQANLFDMLENGTKENGAVVSNLKIKGSDIYIALKNYSSIMKKTGKSLSL